MGEFTVHPTSHHTYHMVSTKDTEMKWCQPFVSTELTSGCQRTPEWVHTQALHIEHVCKPTTHTSTGESSLITYNAYNSAKSVNIATTQCSLGSGISKPWLLECFGCSFKDEEEHLYIHFRIQTGNDNQRKLSAGHERCRGVKGEPKVERRRGGERKANTGRKERKGAGKELRWLCAALQSLGHWSRFNTLMSTYLL